MLTRVRNILEVRLLNNQIKDQNNVLDGKVKERIRELNETRLSVIQCLGKTSWSSLMRSWILCVLIKVS